MLAKNTKKYELIFSFPMLCDILKTSHAISRALSGFLWYPKNFISRNLQAINFPKV